MNLLSRTSTSSRSESKVRFLQTNTAINSTTVVGDSLQMPKIGLMLLTGAAENCKANAARNHDMVCTTTNHPSQRHLRGQYFYCTTINSLRPRQNGRHFADDIFKCIFVNENAWISLKNSLKFVPKVRINNIAALVQIMAWCRPGDQPLPESIMVNLQTHICVTRPQWVKKQ